MIPGSVAYWKDFTFYDGGQADKVLIFLNHKRNDQFLVLRTTSQPHQSRPPIEGCQHENGCYFVPGGRKWFKRDTWILLFDPYILGGSDCEDAELNGTCRELECLDDQLLRAIINCFKKSEDCSDHHLWLLS